MYNYCGSALLAKYHEYIQRSELSLDDHIPLYLHQTVYSVDLHLKMLQKKRIRFHIILLLAVLKLGYSKVLAVFDVLTICLKETELNCSMLPTHSRPISRLSYYFSIIYSNDYLPAHLVITVLGNVISC